MKVRIVSYEDPNGWIVGKFALKLNEYLIKLGIASTIDNKVDLDADINHHLTYLNYSGKESTVDTLMITHVDDLKRLSIIKKDIVSAEMGVCMSKETMLNLVSLGLPREKLCYINPANDDVFKPRPFLIGIATRVYDDGRKREKFLGQLAKFINPNFFSFTIMGTGWKPQVKQLIDHGFTVEYFPDFDYDKYIQLIPSLDYYLYFGMDEGQIGFIDALKAGVKTIITPQGFHLDAINGITHGFTSFEELLDVFIKIENEKKDLINSVSTWNWNDYAKKHIEVWKYLLNKQSYVLDSNIQYKDGINSINNESYGLKNETQNNKLKLRIRFTSRYIRYVIYKIKHIILNTKELKYTKK